MYNKELFERARNKVSDKPLEIVRKEKLIKRIADLEKELVEAKNELKTLEKEVLMSGMNILQKSAEAKNIKLSKKEAIIQYFKINIPIEKIASTVNASESYVRKVISIYRKDNGIKPISKGAETKRKVFMCLDEGMSVGEIAVSLEITPQYVSQIKAEYDARQQLGIVCD